ncbi:MAG: 3-deoxy-D-manno-octulosonic acid transferase [Flavobacteriales bacterium]
MLAQFFYNLGIYGYSGAISIASLWNKKAALWINGRKNWKEHLLQWKSQNSGKLFWFHCASLGEFEQGRPVLEAIRKSHPEIKILLTFFSPSGFEIRKKYQGADFICYLPADTPTNAHSFLEIIKPDAVFFVKYEYWSNYFFSCKKQNTPLFVISAILRPDQRFFGVFKSYWLKVLRCVDHFFVQNEKTLDLLNENGFQNATLCGDTRFDRVVEIAAKSKEIPEIAAFVQNAFTLVAGSSWPQDEELIARSAHLERVKVICVPHEINETHILAIEKKFPDSIRWSQLRGKSLNNSKVMIVDSIGMLSSIYQYADAVMIGGGFGKGIHNTLEAAVWGKPIVFGPKFEKFEEARELIRRKAAISIINQQEFDTFLDEILNHADKKNSMSQIAKEYVQSSAGATLKIVDRLKSQNIL